MSKFTLKGKAARAAVGITAASLAIGSSVIGGSPAGADPKQAAAMVAAGSDTTQDILNAMAGFVNNINFTPVQSTDAGKRQIASWDAIPPPGASTCITPKGGGATFLRPNGSTNGRRAVSRAIDGTNWPNSTPDCGGAKPITNLVDFARSSAGPPAEFPGTQLTYVPFGRDALTFAYYKSDGGALDTLTSVQLNELFTQGPKTYPGPGGVGTVDVVPCGIQTGSGTYQSWNTSVGATQALETAATTTVAGNCGPRTQENDGVGLKARGDALPGKQVVIGFSAANFIAQANGFAGSQLAPGVDLGAINDGATALGKPYSGTLRFTAADGTTTAGSAVISSPTLAATAADVGARVSAPAAAGVAPGPGSTIVSVQSATSVTLTAPSTASAAGTARFAIAKDVLASTTFYASTKYGRDVYNVVPTARFGGLAGANLDFKSMFKDPTSSVCLASATINNFGFAPLGSACGSITLQGGLIPNA